MPNTLIFFDFPSDDPGAPAELDPDVSRWVVEPRPEDVFQTQLILWGKRCGAPGHTASRPVAGTR